MVDSEDPKEWAEKIKEVRQKKKKGGATFRIKASA